MKVTTYNETGYRLEVAVLDSMQVRCTRGPCRNTSIPYESLGEGVSVAICPSDYPEMVKFVISVEYEE